MAVGSNLAILLDQNGFVHICFDATAFSITFVSHAYLSLQTFSLRMIWQEKLLAWTSWW